MDRMKNEEEDDALKPSIEFVLLVFVVTTFLQEQHEGGREDISCIFLKMNTLPEVHPEAATKKFQKK